MPTLPKTSTPSFAEIQKKTYEILGYRPCLWQIRVVEAILKHDKDIITIAATGSGKTLTFWMPLLFKKDGIQIVITLSTSSESKMLKA
jgi:superfamily II DNA/RNA helicase